MKIYIEIDEKELDQYLRYMKELGIEDIQTLIKQSVHNYCSNLIFDQPSYSKITFSTTPPPYFSR